MRLIAQLCVIYGRRPHKELHKWDSDVLEYYIYNMRLTEAWNITLNFSLVKIITGIYIGFYAIILLAPTKVRWLFIFLKICTALAKIESAWRKLKTARKVLNNSEEIPHTLFVRACSQKEIPTVYKARGSVEKVTFYDSLTHNR